MVPAYNTLRRIVVGTDEYGQQVTMRCFINEDASATESKFYLGRLTTPYGQELVHCLHESLQYAGNTPEEQATTMRRAWFQKFNFVGQNSQAELIYNEDSKRMRVAYTSHHGEIWASWKIKATDGEPTPVINFWPSSTAQASLRIRSIEDVIDLHTLVPEIRLRGQFDWKKAALNLLALHWNLEEPLEDEQKVEDSVRKRVASGVPKNQRGTSKKPKMKDERNGYEVHSSFSTPT